MNDRKPGGDYVVVDVHAFAMRNEEGQNGGLKFEVMGLIDLPDEALAKLSDRLIKATQEHLIEEGWLAPDTIRVGLNENGEEVGAPVGEKLQ